MGSKESASKDLKLLRGQVMPRGRQLIVSWVPLAALLAGAGLAIALPELPSASMQISTVAGYGFTFASIAMGACMSALVLSIGLPGARRLRQWSLLSGATPGKSALSDLIFVLVWAAIAQIGLTLVCVCALAFGADLPVAPKGMLPSHAVSLGIGFAVFFYSVFELVVVIQTLSQIGVLIIFEERSQPAATDDTADRRSSEE